MKIVVDTNVLVYALVGVQPERDTALAVLGKADRLIAPDLLWSEAANALWKWAQFNHLPPETALQALDEVGGLIDDFLTSDALVRDALVLAQRYNHPVYDAVFVAAAMQLGIPLVSFGQRLLQAFPAVTTSADAFLADQAGRPGGGPD